MPGPRYQSVSLCDHPIFPTIQIQDREGSIRVLWRYECLIWGRRRNALVYEWYARKCSLHRAEEGEGRYDSFGFAAQSYERTFSCVEVRRGGEAG